MAARRRAARTGVLRAQTALYTEAREEGGIEKVVVGILLNKPVIHINRQRAVTAATPAVTHGTATLVIQRRALLLRPAQRNRARKPRATHTYPSYASTSPESGAKRSHANARNAAARITNNTRLWRGIKRIYAKRTKTRAGAKTTAPRAQRRGRLGGVTVEPERAFITR